MRVFAGEFAKLWRTSALAGFLLICIGLNLVMLVAGPQTDYPRFVAGSQAVRVSTTDSPLAARFATDRAGQRNVFSDFDPVALAAAYRDTVGYDRAAGQLIAAKYAQAVPIVAQRSADRRALDLYYASETGQLHGFLFGSLLGAVTIQTFIFAAIAGIQTRSVEETAGPGPVVYSSRTGRSVLPSKLAAALASTALAHLVLSSAAVGSAAARYHLPGVWHSSVSSSFNQVQDIVVGPRPFFTWLDLDVGGYLLGSLAVGLALSLSVGLAAWSVGALIPNSYLGFGLLLIGGGLLFTGPILGGPSLPALLLGLNPVWLWLKQPAWFTDGGLDVLVPHFEIVGTLASLLLSAAAAAWAHRRFSRSDL